MKERSQNNLEESKSKSNTTTASVLWQQESTLHLRSGETSLRGKKLI